MKLRTLLFWTHLAAGLVAGSVILIMSVTGTLLTFQQSVLKMVERSQRFVEVPAGAERLGVDALLARVRQAVPDAEPTTVTLDSDPRVSASVALGQRGTVFVNPYTGDVLGSGSSRARAFYRSVPAGTATSRSRASTAPRPAPSPAPAMPRFSCSLSRGSICGGRGSGRGAMSPQ